MARAVSLVLALATSSVALLAPFLIARQISAGGHAVASAMMLGITGAFVHGMGFTPRARVWRVLFHPLLAWTLILGAAAWFLF